MGEFVPSRSPYRSPTPPSLKLWLMGLCPLVLGSWGCTDLHHAQIGDLDDRPGFYREKFQIKVSEDGVDIKRSDLSQRKVLPHPLKASNDVVRRLRHLQVGPRTGSPVLSALYAHEIPRLLGEACPIGRPTNLVILRESKKDPVASGEAIRIEGDCESPL